MATGVLVVAVSALAAATTHLWRFVYAGGDSIDTVVSICLFTVPGMMVGGQLGPRSRLGLSQHALARALGVLFAAIGALMLGQVAF